MEFEQKHKLIIAYIIMAIVIAFITLLASNSQKPKKSLLKELQELS